MIQSLALRNVRQFAYPVVGVLLMTFCSKVFIPLKPVPITLQTVGLMVIGLCFSKKHALQSISAYLSLGAIGVPVFISGTAGLFSFFNPLAGFLVGFLVSVWLMTTVREKFDLSSFWGMLAVAAVGQVSLYACGIAWLSNSIGFELAIKFGLLPFIVPGIFKGLLVSGIVRFIKNVK